MNALFAVTLALAALAPSAPWQLELDVPIGARSLAGAASDSAEIAWTGGVRGGVCYAAQPWLLALDVAGRVALPDQRGTSQVQVNAQQSWLSIGGRAGWRAQARGFAIEPFWFGRIEAGGRWRTIRVSSVEQSELQPLIGLASGAGWSVGRDHWRLRLDAGSALDRRGLAFTAELALGYVW